MSDAGEKAFPVSWEQFHRDSKALAWRLADKAPDGDWVAMVAITRGGLVPAAVIARELNIRRIETVCMSSYDYKEQGEGIEVIKEISQSLIEETDGGKNVLIVDELTDTGRTAKAVRDMLPNAHFGTVYAKPSGRPLVDTYITEVSQDTWIYFPWDLGLSFQSPIRSGGE